MPISITSEAVRGPSLHTRLRLPALPLIVLLLMTAAVAGCGSDERETLVIAVQPSATQEELSAQASELEQFLEQSVDADIEIRFPTSYGGVIESLRFGHADAAFMGAWPAALATREEDGKKYGDVVLAEIREVIIGENKAEEPYYFSYWVVPPDSPYQFLQDLRDKKAAFPNQLSTSGFVAPMARLKELGLVSPAEGESVDPEDFFGEAFFAGGYSQAWEALKAGQVDVSVIAGDVPEELYREVLDNTRVIEEQGPIPSHAVVFSSEFDDPLRSDLKQALLELGEDEHRELMRKFVSGIFVSFEETTTEEHLRSLNDFLEETGLEFQESIQRP